MIQLRPFSTDLLVYDQVFGMRQYDFDLPFYPKVIVDGGANIGLASVFFGRKYPDAKIIALEPEPENFRVLCENIKENKNIIPVQAALWGRDGQVNLSGGGWSAKTAEGNGTNAITIPTLMRLFGLPKIDLLKLDIEGAEAEILQQCGWLKRVRALAIEVHSGCQDIVDSATCGEFVFVKQNGEISLFTREAVI